MPQDHSNGFLLFFFLINDLQPSQDFRSPLGAPHKIAGFVAKMGAMAAKKGSRSSVKKQCYYSASVHSRSTTVVEMIDGFFNFTVVLLETYFFHMNNIAAVRL